MNKGRLIDNFIDDSEEEDIELEDLYINNTEKEEIARYKDKNDLKNADKFQSQMEKYKHKKISYNEWKDKQDEENDEVEEDEEIVESLENEEVDISDDQEGVDEAVEDSAKVIDADEYEKTKTQLDEEDKEYLQTITKHTTSEIQKGKNVQSQKILFESFIGIRIYLQKILSVVNLLPQGESLAKFLDNKSLQNYKETVNSFCKLLSSFIKIQKSILKKTNFYSKIDNYLFDEINEALNNISEQSVDDLENPFNNLQQSIRQICEKIINIWYRKTLTYTYKSNTKLMRILNNNFCEHIKTNINNNFENFRNNSRKKNPNEQILGKKTASFAKETDKQIFNDADFYNYLLKEFVSNKQDEDTADNNNRYDLTLQYVLNRNKNKKSKNVDTKASKNRKIRYDKHEKLVNFMVPLVNHNINSGRDEIIKSIFGLNKVRNNANVEYLEDNDIEII
jgi:protein AATF/BFR2